MFKNKTMKRIFAGLAVVAATTVVTPGESNATLIDCSITSEYWYTGLRAGGTSVCHTTYGAAGQQRIRIKCYNADTGLYYYRYGPWKNEDVESHKTCDSVWHVATALLIQYRDI